MGLSKLIVAVGLAVSVPLGTPSEPLKTMDEIKRWRLAVNGNWVDLKLSSYEHAGRPLDTTLFLAAEDGTSATKARDQAEVIARVLKEMPTLGYEPAHLETIVFPLEGSDVEREANLAVSKSGKWKDCLRICPKTK